MKSFFPIKTKALLHAFKHGHLSENEMELAIKTPEKISIDGNIIIIDVLTRVLFLEHEILRGQDYFSPISFIILDGFGS